MLLAAAVAVLAACGGASPEARELAAADLEVTSEEVPDDVAQEYQTLLFDVQVACEEAGREVVDLIIAGRVGARDNGFENVTHKEVMEWLLMPNKVATEWSQINCMDHVVAFVLSRMNEQ